VSVWLRALARSPWAYVIVIALGFVVYSDIRSFGLDKLDEDVLLRDNMEYLVRKASVVDIVQRDAFFQAPGESFFRPLQNLSYLLDARIGRGKAAPFYWTNGLLHGLAGILLLHLLRRVEKDDLVALFTALLFTVSPLVVQAVAWIPGRGDLLLTLFALAALNSILAYLRSGSLAMASVLGVSVFLAMMSKETGIVLVVVLPLAFLLTDHQPAELRRRLLVASLLCLFSAAALLLSRSMVITRPAPWQDFSVAHLVLNLRVFLEIAGKFVWPGLLQTMAGYTLAASTVGALVLALLGGLSRAPHIVISRRPLIFGLLWYGAFLLPGVLYAHRLGGSAYDYLEHRGYGAVVGLLIPLALIIAKGLRGRPQWLIGLMPITIVVSGFFAWRHTAHFATAEAFYTQAVVSNPASAVARSARGLVRESVGDTAGAVSDYTAAIRLNPSYTAPRFNLAGILLGQQQFDAALAQLRVVAANDPALPQLALTYADALMGKGDLQGAQRWYGRYHQYDPLHLRSTITLGVVEARLGNWPRARDLFTEAIALDASSAKAWLNRGIAHQNLGLLAEACTDWWRAEELGSEYAARMRASMCSPLTSH
jgi:tetratricopeptide (TPR) repeat protein